MSERNELDAAGGKLEEDLLARFEGLRLMPDAVVESIDHAGYCEDCETFMATCRTIGGGTLFVSMCPGEPVHVEPATARWT